MSCTRPTAFHEDFLRVGQVLRVVGAATATFSMPERLSLVANRPIVIAANHRSLFDLVAAMAVFTRFGLSARILVRGDYVNGQGRGLARVVGLSHLGGMVLQRMGCIAVTRRGAADAEAEAVAALRRGELVAIMPEGRLIPSERWVNDVGPAKPGVSRIARAADAVVIPVAISGTERLWPPHRWPRPKWPRRRITIRVGEPIELCSDHHSDNAALIMDRIAALLA